MSYAELAVTTNFSFLRGASHPGDFVEQAWTLGYAAIGIADRNTLAGVVRAYERWKKLDDPPRLLIGARLVFRDGTPDVLAYPKDRKAYARLSRLISVGKLRAQKGEWVAISCGNSACRPAQVSPPSSTGAMSRTATPSSANRNGEVR